MLVVRFRVQCQPESADEMFKRMSSVVRAARGIPGVLHFDVGRDVTDDHAFIATEVFENREAMEREEAIPEVAAVVELLESGALTGPPEWTIYEIASSETPSM